MEIKMKNFTVEVNNAETVAAAMDSLPIYQSIRGCDQWTQEKRDALVKDILGGLYVPPIVFAVEVDEETGEKRLVIIDGQQRGRAIRDAVANGTMPKDTPIITAVDNGRGRKQLVVSKLQRRQTAGVVRGYCNHQVSYVTFQIRARGDNGGRKGVQKWKSK